MAIANRPDDLYVTKAKASGMLSCWLHRQGAKHPRRSSASMYEWSPKESPVYIKPLYIDQLYKFVIATLDQVPILL